MKHTTSKAIPLVTRKHIFAIGITLPFVVYAAVAHRLILGDYFLTTAMSLVLCWGVFGLLSHTSFGRKIGTILNRASVEQTRPQKNIHFSIMTVACCTALVAIALVQSRANINATNFQNDEFYHVDVAAGYLQTGQPVLWDFMHEQPQVDINGHALKYARAWPYSWQVVQSVTLFGFSESSARLPSTLWFVLSMLLIFFVLRFWSRDELYAFLIPLTLVFCDHFILHARMVRMYSMLVFFSTASLTLWFATYRYSLRDHARLWKWGVLALCTMAVTVVGLWTHAILLLALPGFIVFVGVEYLRTYGAEPLSATVKQKIHLWFLSMCVLSIAAIWSAVVTHHVHYFDLVSFGGELNQVYELLPFQDLPVALAGMVAFVIGCWYALRSRIAVHRYAAILSLCVIGLLAFVTHRYHALRYIVFMIPMIIAIAGVVVYRVLRVLTTAITVPPVRVLCITVAFILLFVPLSWPGVPANRLFAQSPADKTHQNGFGHNFAAAYQFIQDHKKPDEALLSIDARTYYWGKSTEQILSLGNDGSLSVNQFQALIAAHQHGWIFWANGKAHHLRKKVLALIEQNATNVSDQNTVLQKANVTVYRY